MRVPSVAQLLDLPAGDRLPRLRVVLRRHLARVAELEALDPHTIAPAQRASLTRHRRALAQLEHVARQCGIDPRV